MRAIVVRCPNCGANLKIASTVASVTCAYCDTVSRIQPRTGVFQRPAPMPPVAAAGPGTRLPPIARQRVSRAAMIVPFVIVAIVVGGVAFTVHRVKVSAGERLFWGGKVPVRIDVDGDGVRDLVGLVQYVMQDQRAHLAAYSGKTGAPLWQSEPLGKLSDLSQAMLGTTGDLVLFATERGTLAARDKAGTPRWQLDFGEKIEELCAGAAPGEVVVATADRKWYAVDAAGKRRDTQPLVRFDRDYTTDGVAAQFARIGGERPPGVCVSVATVTWRRPAGLLALEPWTGGRELPGMRVELRVRRPAGPIVAIGGKSPGTRVPMLAGLDDAGAVRWKVEIPAIDPLNTRFDRHDVAISDHAVIALYQSQRPVRPHLTAFDLETGRRLWDRELVVGAHASFTSVGLVADGDQVMVTTWTGLRVHALADGRERFSIGDR